MFSRDLEKTLSKYEAYKPIYYYFCNILEEIHRKKYLPQPQMKQGQMPIRGDGEQF